MYAINDYVITRSYGICQITEIENNNSATDICFVLKTHDHSQDIIKTPAESGELMRKISNKEEALEIIDRMPYIPTIQIPKKTMRDQIYESVMDQYEAIEWIKMIKTVYQREKEKSVTEQELSLAEKARHYLLTELSLALDIPYNEVEPFIQKSIRENF